MIYRITAEFSDTEAAQSAARRIDSENDDVLAIRMSYVTRHGDKGSLNSIYYTFPSMSALPYGAISTGAYPLSSSEELPTDNTRASAFDFGETCRLTVLTSEKGLDEARKVIHNANGYGMQVIEQDS